MRVEKRYSFKRAPEPNSFSRHTRGNTQGNTHGEHTRGTHKGNTHKGNTHKGNTQGNTFRKPHSREV